MVSDINNNDHENPFVVRLTRKEAMELLLSLVCDENKAPIQLFKVNDREVRFRFVLLLSELLTTEIDQPTILNYHPNGTVTHE